MTNETELMSLEEIEALENKWRCNVDASPERMRLISTARGAHELKAENEELKKDVREQLDELNEIRSLAKKFVPDPETLKPCGALIKQYQEIRLLTKEINSLREQLRVENERNDICCADLDAYNTQINVLKEQLRNLQESYGDVFNEGYTLKVENEGYKEQLRTARAEEREKISLIFDATAEIYRFDKSARKLFEDSVNALGDAEPAKEKDDEMGVEEAIAAIEDLGKQS